MSHWSTIQDISKSSLNNEISLIRFLLSMDCVRYLQYLETLLSSYTPTLGALDRRERPAWLGTPAADTIFKTARYRVYRQKEVKIKSTREMSVDGLEIPNDLDDGDWMVNGGSTEDDEEMLRIMEEEEEEAAARARETREETRNVSEMPPPALPPRRARRWLPPGVEPVLEEQPKWLLLSEVLEEIETQMHWAAVDPCEIDSDFYPRTFELTLDFLPSDGYSNDTILVMCSSSSDCYNLGNYLSQSDLTSSGQALLESNLKSYFWWKSQVSKLSRSLKKTSGFSKSSKPSTSSSSNASASSKSSTSAGTPSFGTIDKGKKTGGMEISAALKRKDAQRGGGGSGPSTKRRRIRGGGAIGSGSNHSNKDERATFAAATGANPEAFEEDAAKLAEMFVASFCSLSFPEIQFFTIQCTVSINLDHLRQTWKRQTSKKKDLTRLLSTNTLV